jgi:hypothetical protein
MGANKFTDLIYGKGVNQTVVEASYEHVPTIENYFYHTSGSLFPRFGQAVEIKLKLPPGNYEIEAIVRLFNNNAAHKNFGCHLYFFLDDSERSVWEGGEIGPSLHSPPYVTQFKVMSRFNTSKEIRFSMGTNAESAFAAENACLLVRRISTIVFKSK